MTHNVLTHNGRPTRPAAMTRNAAAWLLAACLLQGCQLVDDNLDDCGEQFTMDYQLRLVTNMSVELQTVLHADADKPLRDALSEALKDVFTDYARDVDLSFYGTDSLCHVHEDHQMNANEASYTIFLPVEEYMHLATANVAHQQQVHAAGQTLCQTAFLDHSDATVPPAWERALGVMGNIVDSHAAGLFTARQPMHVLAGTNQTFNVRLYMANCAMALVMDTTDCDATALHVYADGLADGFLVRDSLYTYRYGSLLRLFAVDTAPYAAPAARAAGAAPLSQLCFCGVGFPSRDVPASAADATVWRLRVYVTLPDGTTTENVVNVRQPLRAGQLKVIRCRLTGQGIVESTAPEVGVSVTLDWKPGGTYHPVIR